MSNKTTFFPLSSQHILDINAGMAYLMDCLVTLFVIGSVLSNWFSLPANIVFGRIIPGMVVGALLGNILLAWLARKTRIQTNNLDIAAVPIGPDIVTVLVVSFFIVGPAYQQNIATLGSENAAIYAWKLGMAATLWLAAIKVVGAFFGRAIITAVPIMALLASMSGVAIVWLGAEAINNVFSLPTVGIVSLVIMLYSLTAGHKLPLKIPGAAFALIVATMLYYVLALIGGIEGYTIPSNPGLYPVLPFPTLQGTALLFGGALDFVGMLIPLAVLTMMFAINVVAGARALGDDYDVRQVIAIDAIATAATGLFGGIAQTTPYGGHATYRRMGGRLNYTLVAITVIAITGFCGLVAFGALVIPDAALKPILVIVACDIVLVAFTRGDMRHAPAFTVAIIPAVFNYAYTKTTELFQLVDGNLGNQGADIISLVGVEWYGRFVLLGALANGYILTSVLWASMVVWIINGKMQFAAYICFICALLTLFGVIHSVLPTAGMYFPWELTGLDYARSLPYELAASYAFVGVIILLLHFFMINSESQLIK